jgi:predicted amidohydrolase
MPIASTLRASVVQFEAVPDRPDLNLKSIRRLASEAAADGAQTDP